MWTPSVFMDPTISRSVAVSYPLMSWITVISYAHWTNNWQLDPKIIKVNRSRGGFSLGGFSLWNGMQNPDQLRIPFVHIFLWCRNKLPRPWFWTTYGFSVPWKAVFFCPRCWCPKNIDRSHGVFFRKWSVVDRTKLGNPTQTWNNIIIYRKQTATLSSATQVLCFMICSSR